MLKVKAKLKEKELVKVRENYQITIPYNLRRPINIGVGDYVEFRLGNGNLTIRPVKIVSSGQEYFYTKKWQKKEAEADKDIVSGRVAGPFANIKDALKALKKKK